MTAIRLPASFVLSLCTTAMLFWFLAMMTAVDPHGRVIHTVGQVQIAPVLVPEPPIVTTPPVRPPPPQKPKPTPDAPSLLVTPAVTPGQDESDLLPPEWFEGPGRDLTRPGEGEVALPHVTGNADRGPIPQVQILPDYPIAAKDRGIEGWITFRFTVAVDGSVKDIEIVDAQPPRIWDSATIRAVSAWRYQPAMRDSMPVEQTGVMVTYRYELER
jgi:periplasmic protein TonB